MKIFVTGASGGVGAALVPFLEAQGHVVTRWGRSSGRLEVPVFEGVEAVIHLAGENIGSRWTPAKKARIMESRRQGTRLLCETLARLPKPPGVLVAASAIGFYGDRGEEVLTEASATGTGFLAEVCREWEAATVPAAAGIRVVNLRIGLVLDARAGALARMAPVFRWGLGGVMGSGRQYWSWIAIDDMVRVVMHVIEKQEVRGPVNAVAPQPVTNREFTKTLGRVLRRPTIFPVPAGVVRLGFGEMGEVLFLASARVEPARLLAAGYQFRQPALEPALREMLITGF